MSRFCRALALGITSFVLGACSGSGDQRTNDPPARSVDEAEPQVPTARNVAPAIWGPGLGMVLLIPLDSADRSIIAFADSSTDPGDAFRDRSTFVALGRNGSAITVGLSDVRDRDGCLTGTVTRADLPGQSAGGFAIGVLSDAVTMLPTDSTEGFSRTDSIALARDLIALASVIPGDTARQFTGLPFRLLRLWRVKLPGDGALALATLRRQIPQEAAPSEERTVVIATRRAGSAAWVTAHSERADGPEESVQTTELVAAMSVGGAPVIVLARDDGEGVAFQLLSVTDRGLVVGHTGPRQRC
jgi:hypothetical protein